MLKAPRKPVRGLTASVSIATPGMPQARANDTACSGLIREKKGEEKRNLLNQKDKHRQYKSFKMKVKLQRFELREELITILGTKG